MQSRRILLYYPPNTRSVAVETICQAMKDEGHSIIVLTLTEKGPFHEQLATMGIEAHSYVLDRKPSWKYFVGHTRYLVRFCRKHRIDTVWSHLQEANLIAVLAHRFLKCRVYCFRHHDESSFYAEYGKQFGMVRNRKEIWIDKFINRFASKIVVLSNHQLDTMTRYEKCKRHKIIVCPLMYDFSKLTKPDPALVDKLKKENPCQLRLIMVGRMIESKQHLVAFKVVHKLIKSGYSIRMIVLDEGPLRNQLVTYIRDNDLQDDIILTGFRTDQSSFMMASDILLHPSLTEASNNVVKEMGFLGKPVIVCEGVGDFDDYIEEDKNAYILDRSRLEATIEKSVVAAFNSRSLQAMGTELRTSVLAHFSDSRENRERYLQLT